MSAKFVTIIKRKRGIDEIMRNRIRDSFSLLGQFKTLQALAISKDDGPAECPARVIQVFMEN